MWSLVAPAALLAVSARAQVTAAGRNGPTNPDQPEFYPIGAQVNQTSLSRLLTLNSVDDFCMYGPMEPGPESLVGNVEHNVVAWCTKPRNNARLIPDGTIQSAHFVKTPLYVQIHGFWDGTKVNIPWGDMGGELDPHGATNKGNPVGGNVTSNVGGTDVFYEEWMSFISYEQFCLRVCTAETANITAALQCEHELDIMGCRFVMAIEDFYRGNNSFTSCEGEAAAAPGLYPLANGTVSTFRQRYTGTWTDAVARETHVYTVGQTVTPTAPAFWPKSSNCVSYSTIANGVNVTDMVIRAAPTLLAGSAGSSIVTVGTTSMATITSITGLPSPTPSTQSTSGDAAAGAAAATSVDAQGNTVSAAPTSSPTGGASVLAPAGIVAILGVAFGALAVF